MTAGPLGAEVEIEAPSSKGWELVSDLRRMRVEATGPVAPSA